MSGPEEEKQMEMINTLTEQAVGKYEDLQQENEKTKEECARLKQERDNVVSKLNEFQKISQMVIEEVSTIQSHLEIEKTCRESAEAFATKLNKENKSLKRISMLCMAKLGPDVITEEINIDDESSAAETENGSATCSSLQCQQQTKDLQDKLLSLLEEKKTLANSQEDLKDKLEEMNKQKQENIVLSEENLKQKKLLDKYNRVSVLAVEEYEELHSNFELEKGLRTQAETFAHEMFVEQNKLKRQSQLLLQNAMPNQQLMKALEDIAELTQILEQERTQYQQEIKDLKEQLENSSLQKEINLLKCQLEFLEKDKKELESKCSNSEQKVKDLKQSVEELQKQTQQAENPRPFIPPPPPLPPPVPPPSNPIRSLMSIIRKKGNSSTSVSKASETDQSSHQESDLKKKAVEEMMERIKKGVNLRPVNQSTRPKPQVTTTKVPEGAVKELKGMLDILKTSNNTKISKTLDIGSSETELEGILRRRKMTTEQDQCLPGELAILESKSMPALSSLSDAVRNKANRKPIKKPTKNISPPSMKNDGNTNMELTFQSLDDAEESTSKNLENDTQSGSLTSTSPLAVANEACSENHIYEETDKLCKMEQREDNVKNDPLYDKVEVSNSSSNC
nr:PREDICTED: shootin-1 isoform X2 [Latimeria chalumnae]|eukprot:XP_005995791.1 PREDICTED: shootin-1 isoform X2 [Latimeria chalumnae]